jgi:predicted permease
VLLSWSLWKRRFGGDPAILNQTIHLDGAPYTVIGILPAWFSFPDAANQLWTLVYHDDLPGSYQLTSLGNHSFRVVGRLRDGVAPSQGLADVALITRRVHDRHLDNPFVGMTANARPLIDDMVGNVRRPLMVLLAAAGCVLLIACLNVANLLVARSVARRKELAIRMALGGGRLRLLRERLTESLLLSAIGGAVGMLLAVGAIEWFVRVRHDMSRVDSIHIDGAVITFSLVLVAFCAMFAGIVSAFGAQQKKALAGLSETSRSFSSGRARATLRRVLLTLELGLTVVLLIGAGLLLKSYERLRAADMGCVTQNVLTMSIDLSGDRYKEPAQIANFYETLLTRVRALPGVTAAGFVRGVPGQGYLGDEGFTIAEHPPLPQGQAQFTLNRWADPGYFQAMGIPILRGHTFDPARRLDQANQAVISESFASQYLPNEDPIGKHVQVEGRKYEIVGIVGDTRYRAEKPAKPIQYYPLYTGIWDYGTLVIRSDHGVEQFALPVQRIVQGIDRDLPVSDVLTMDQVMGRNTMDASFDATLLLVFAALSLLLVAVGLFGVLSYIVAQRTSEIGIRIALGAQREQVLSQVLFDGLRPALFGLILGLAASVGAARLIQSMLYGTQPLDPAVFAAVSAILLFVAALACALPAWRASRLDPMQALRTE